MAKSAMDRFKAMSNKKIIEFLDCPCVYGLIGIYTCDEETAIEASDEKCYTCWTKKF